MPEPGPLLVTGASSDLGVALIRALLKHETDSEIIAHCFSERDRLDTIASELADAGRLRIIGGDLSTIEGATALVGALRQLGPLPHRVVHLPALPLTYERFGKADLARFARDMMVQVTSLAMLLQAILPEIVLRRRTDPDVPNGKVVAVSSSVLLGVPPKNTTMYTTVKFAQAGLLRALAADYAEQRVNVNAVTPSMIETGFLASIPAKAVEMAAAQNPTRRNGTPADVVPMLEFLLSPASDYITGVGIPITGGIAF